MYALVFCDGCGCGCGCSWKWMPMWIYNSKAIRLKFIVDFAISKVLFEVSKVGSHMKENAHSRTFICFNYQYLINLEFLYKGDRQ
jgi:hypothetical protein